MIDPSSEPCAEASLVIFAELHWVPARPPQGAQGAQEAKQEANLGLCESPRGFPKFLSFTGAGGDGLLLPFFLSFWGMVQETGYANSLSTYGIKQPPIQCDRLTLSDTFGISCLECLLSARIWLGLLSFHPSICRILSVPTKPCIILPLIRHVHRSFCWLRKCFERTAFSKDGRIRS